MLFIIQDDRVLFKTDGEKVEDYQGICDLILVGENDNFYDPIKKELVKIPVKPVGDYLLVNNKWIKIEPDISIANFKNFYTDVKNSDVWHIIKDHGCLTPALNMAVTLLLQAVTTTFDSNELKEGFCDFMKAFYEYHTVQQKDDVIMNKKTVMFIQSLLDNNQIPVNLLE